MKPIRSGPLRTRDHPHGGRGRDEKPPPRRARRVIDPEANRHHPTVVPVGPRAGAHVRPARQPAAASAPRARHARRSRSGLPPRRPAATAHRPDCADRRTRRTGTPQPHKRARSRRAARPSGGRHGARPACAERPSRSPRARRPQYPQRTSSSARLPLGAGLPVPVRGRVSVAGEARSQGSDEGGPRSGAQRP